ncbi:MAG: hypothetical protein ACM3UZ_02085 [Acidobacteriota bacterium]
MFFRPYLRAFRRLAFLIMPFTLVFLLSPVASAGMAGPGVTPDNGLIGGIGGIGGFGGISGIGGGGSAGKETVLFQDTFARKDNSSPGPAWEEIINRQSQSYIAKPGETPWSIKNNSLYYESTGDGTYIEDSVQTKAAYPVDNIKIEYELRASVTGKSASVGPSALLLEDARYKGSAYSTTRGMPAIGEQCWYNWQSSGSSGLILLANSNILAKPDKAYAGVNQGSFSKHTIIVKNSKVAFQTPTLGSAEMSLGLTLLPNESRRLAFSVHIFDKGLKQTVEIRNLKISAFPSSETVLEDKMDQEAATILSTMNRMVQAVFDETANQFVNLANTRTPQIRGRVHDMVISQVQPVIKDTINQRVQTAKTQYGSVSVLGSYGNLPPELQVRLDQIRAEAIKQAFAIIDSVTQQQIDALLPPVKTTVQKETNACVEQAQAILRPQIAGLTPTLKTYMRSSITNSINNLKPYLTPELKKLKPAELDAKLRPLLEARIQPCIDALIKAKAENLIEQKLISKIQEIVMQEVTNQINSITADLISYTESQVRTQLPGTTDAMINLIKDYMRQQIMSYQNLILEQVRNEMALQTNVIVQQMNTYLTMQVFIALNPKPAGK